MLDSDTFRTELHRLDGDGDDADYVLDHLGLASPTRRWKDDSELLESRVSHPEPGGQDDRPHPRDRRTELYRPIRERHATV